LVERGGDSEVPASGIHAEFVVAAAQVLYERVPVGAEYSAVPSDQRFRDAIPNDQALLTELFVGRRH